MHYILVTILQVAYLFIIYIIFLQSKELEINLSPFYLFCNHIRNIRLKRYIYLCVCINADSLFLLFFHCFENRNNNNNKRELASGLSSRYETKKYIEINLFIF
jgi:hypothetical protein